MWCRALADVKACNGETDGSATVVSAEAITTASHRVAGAAPARRCSTSAAAASQRSRAPISASRAAAPAGSSRASTRLHPPVVAARLELLRFLEVVEAPQRVAAPLRMRRVGCQLVERFDVRRSGARARRPAPGSARGRPHRERSTSAEGVLGRHLDDAQARHRLARPRDRVHVEAVALPRVGGGEGFGRAREVEQLDAREEHDRDVALLRRSRSLW
jgi:hypothetical protein